ncbi:YihY/virulence factor BrkB family protein [Lichenibacterium dinghuense]|uniref:YihY/virulence factor BrkB family protein n=1 Tax=Lichenibacterium dinghuense TaxID=2895977 RepID=UPI001F1E3FDE|nr:YihY/virulence factor BrkB family protein [Lichenibacterium sp. 6Y81]
MTPEEQAEDWRAQVGEEPGAPGSSTDLARAREPGRGREADSPKDIPARGWKDILVRVFWATSANRVLSTAGSVAFFALLAVFPGIAAIVSLYGLFADASTICGHLVLLAGILPAGVLGLVDDQVRLVAQQDNNTLGSAFAISLAVALYSANSGAVALFDALNVVYNEKEERSALRLYATTFAFTLAGVAFTVVALAGVVVLPVVSKFFGLPSLTEWLLAVARWPILLLTIVVSLAVIYRYGPSRNEARWRWVTWGSAIAALLWIAASMLFSWYVATFDSYNRVYGSLGAAVGFMVWLWISAVIVLLGGELNAEVEHQTARDTTEPGRRPLGTRGAMMADHVGKAQG